MAEGLPIAAPGKNGAFGTGVATDTPPQNGCRIATMVAIRELLENPTANRQRIRSVDLAATFGLRMGTC